MFVMHSIAIALVLVVVLVLALTGVLSPGEAFAAAGAYLTGHGTGATVARR